MEVCRSSASSFFWAGLWAFTRCLGLVYVFFKWRQRYLCTCFSGLEAVQEAFDRVLYWALYGLNGDLFVLDQNGEVLGFVDCLE